MKKHVTMKQFAAATTLLLLAACGNRASMHDASGVFESDEVMVSTEISGKLLSLQATEGAKLSAGQVVGQVDDTNLDLQKQQVEASIGALSQKTYDVAPQLKLLRDQYAVQQTQLASLERDQQRFATLVKADAATPKQLDDIEAQIKILQKQMEVTSQQLAVQESTTGTQNRGVLSEQAPLSKRAKQIEDLINRTQITNPINGTVLTQYAHAGEVAQAGKALYKIANLDTLYLRAYLSATQLSQVKLGQQIHVLIDDGAEKYKNYTGVVSWVSDKAEFTPKTVQTKEERANLVYAVKVRVPNDGFLKIGMYGELKIK
jgi:HlyD family secretion protein